MQALNFSPSSRRMVLDESSSEYVSLEDAVALCKYCGLNSEQINEVLEESRMTPEKYAMKNDLCDIKKEIDKVSAQIKKVLEELKMTPEEQKMQPDLPCIQPTYKSPSPASPDSQSVNNNRKLDRLMNRRIVAMACALLMGYGVLRHSAPALEQGANTPSKQFCPRNYCVKPSDRRLPLVL